MSSIPRPAKPANKQEARKSYPGMSGGLLAVLITRTCSVVIILTAELFFSVGIVTGLEIERMPEEVWLCKPYHQFKVPEIMLIDELSTG